MLTGLPRFDRLQRGRPALPRRPARPRAAHPDVAAVAGAGARGGLPGAAPRRRPSLDSEFVQEWVGLLHDPDCAQACERAGVRLAFLPHPNLEKLLPAARPASARADAVLRRHRRAGAVRAGPGARHRLLLDRLQRGLPRAPGRLLPVRRRAQVLAGAHVGQPGYFEYERDGFGPVVHERRTGGRAPSTRRWSTGGAPLPTYVERIEATFPHRDGGCSRARRPGGAGLDASVTADTDAGADTGASEVARGKAAVSETVARRRAAA